MYGGYVDNSTSGNLKFGLNQNVKMVKFEFNPNGGKDGAEQEALDIVFDFGGTERSYRQFPVEKAYGFDNEEISVSENPKNPHVQAAMQQFSNNLKNIIECFAKPDDVRRALSKPITSFKQYVNVLRGLLPGNFAEVSLDVFLHYEFQPKQGKDKTFLIMPKKTTKFYAGYKVKRNGRVVVTTKPEQGDTIILKNGSYAEYNGGAGDRSTWAVAVNSLDSEYWICPHIEPENGDWQAVKTDDEGLSYKDGKDRFHMFKRGKWFMNSNFAHQQNGGSSEESLNQAAENNDSPKTGW